MISPIQTTSIIGLLLSVYALYVEVKSSKNKDYKAFCDIKENMSCNKAFSSKYGRIALLPNSLYGVIFYFVIFLLHNYGYLKYVLYLSISALLGSIFLAYVSYFKLKNFCLVCTGIYLTNITLFLFTYIQINK